MNGSNMDINCENSVVHLSTFSQMMSHAPRPRPPLALPATARPLPARRPPSHLRYTPPPAPPLPANRKKPGGPRTTAREPPGSTEGSPDPAPKRDAGRFARNPYLKYSTPPSISGWKVSPGTFL